MSDFKYSLLLLFFPLFLLAQKPEGRKIKISGTIIEKTTKQPLEYATITFTNTKNPKIIGGGITNNKGEFDIALSPGNYSAKAEFISFKPFVIAAKDYQENTSLGVISLDEDFTQLKAVEVRAQTTSIDIKLDKKVYSVGQDLMVKGGTVSDVLDNIPSVSVDADGTVNLRGNSNVRILIDGKPSNSVNITEALRQIPADAIDKVEVVTNPSARYDAEGGGGILNIILKRGKNQGINGSVIVSAGSPENTGASGNFNIKSKESNFFGSLGYNKSNSPGNTKIDQTNYDSAGNFVSYIEERRNNDRAREGFNTNFGIELYLDKTSSWTNALSIRKNKGGNPEDVFYSIYSNNPFELRQRYNDLYRSSQDIEYTTNFIKKFKRDGHKFTIDGAFSVNRDNETSNIYGNGILPTPRFISSEKTSNNQKQSRNLIQSDYVLPFKKNSQLELGFRGSYLTLRSDYNVAEDRTNSGIFTDNPLFTNNFEYKENINAAYVQLGTKIKKFSILGGLRFEDSNIEINQLATADYNTKKYNNFFPSLFLTYEISETTNISLNYSRRINRPRDRFINPFSSYSSNTSLFLGNPDLDPALSDAYDLGFLKKWKKLTLNTSLYVNHTTDSFQFIAKERGDEIDGIPVIIRTPFNLATDNKFGFEFTLNYTPFKWWRLNGNFNYFSNKTDGSYTYTKINGAIETVDFYFNSSTWFTRLTSKITLPYKIDFQTNGTYNAEQKTAQGRNKANASMNLGLSKDVLKDKGTIAFNVSDVFNSRKRLTEQNTPTVNSDSQMQWRERQITLSFTYRFNKAKNEREKQPKRSDDGGEEY
ncbi:TonB-dependent receptor [Flavobacterium sp. CYK-4]|uniref:outer membrane beta-barrel family protein n=1 Tax=Flavobacterium lotistagni TaxID=2709660 RepID=UPI0014087032|nr:outer membrane beta-barrel family protein [Flavobacterium lotistagni]NHM06938.1 TonB-dependent receptor [Flavobacterium lotistagni]